MMPILAFGFLTPWLFAAGAGATSIPIIIHLLNKRKFRIIVWAAMDFLLAAQRRNARKLKFRRWLLLAVRCLALLILAAGVAQLLLSNAVVGGMLGGQRAIIVVWDDSYSMAWQKPGTRSAFDRSKRLLGDLLAGLPAGDTAMVIHASRGGPVAGNKPTPDHVTLKAQVDAAQVSDAGTDLAGALDQAAGTLKDLENTTSSRQVVVLTDLSRSALAGAQKGEGSGERLKKSVATVQKLATALRVIDLGSDEQANMGVAEIRAQRPVVVAGTPTEFRITVVNATDHPQIDIPLTVSLDGVIVHTEKLGKIEPGNSHNVLASVTAPTAGLHLLEAKLPPDLLQTDDARRLMIDVQREVPVLLVDGSPGDNRTLGSTTYLAVAYSLSAEGKTGGTIFSPKTITELELDKTPLPGYSAVVLSDVGAPTKRVAEDLKKYVEEGGLLIIFPGGRTNAALMDEALGDGGAKLLPATFGQLIKVEHPEQVGEGVTFNPEGFTHPVLQKFGEAYQAGLQVGFTNVQTQQYLKLGVPKDGSVETILRYTTKQAGAAGDAAVVTRPAGKGRVVQFASSADATWNTFGPKPSFLPFLHELMYYSLPRQPDVLTLMVGEKINLPADVASPGAWTAPRKERISVTTTIEKDGRARLTSAALTAAGVYSPATGSGAPVIAVNPDADEIDIRHVKGAAFAAATGLEARDIVLGNNELKMVNSEKGTSGANTDTSIGRWLILAALGFFLVETVLARVFSVYR